MGKEPDAYRSLADQLRSWPEDALRDLLTARPDLTTPAPSDFGQLAARATGQGSISRALDALTQGEMLVLDALVVAGQTTDEGLRAIVYADPSYVDATVDRLRGLALAWDSPEGLRAVSGVADLLAGGPASCISGLCPRSARPMEETELQERLATIGPGARGLLEHIVDEGGHATAGSTRIGIDPEAAETPAEELVAHRLLVPAPTRPGLLMAPGEVGLALRGGRTTTTPIDAAPQIATTPRATRLALNAALGSATDAVRRVELLLDWWGHRPATALRSTGLTARELKSAAGHLGVDERQTALLVEVAAAAGLAASRADAEGAPVWVPTDAYDEWRAGSVAERWVTLARAWLASPRLPSLVGERGPDQKAWNALTPELSAAAMPEAKVMALTELGALPDGETLAPGTGLPSLVARVVWLRPRRPRTRPDLVAWAVEEAAALGISGAGALASYGHSLLAGEDPTPVLAELLPPPVDHVLIQADLTAVAPGPLESALEHQLQQIADLESHGSATVYRFTRDSIRRALDIGWSGAEIHAFLTLASRTAVPQPLSYLVDDTVRTFGRLRVGFAQAFIRSEDEAALLDLVRHPKSEALGLQRIAPTVVVSSTPVDVLLPRLRELGMAPVIEGVDGVVRVGAAESLRARTPKTPARAGGARQAAQVAVAVRSLREGDAETRSRPATASSPATALSALREAIERRATVLIGFTDNHGVISERVVRPVSVEGGQLTAYDDGDPDLERRYPMHRITSVGPAT
ncbi:helicase-associated domain-containing protein [Nocardioides ultimimeridianus]